MIFTLLSRVIMSALMHSPKAPAVLEQVIEAVPLNVSQTEFILYQSKVLSDVIELVHDKFHRRVVAENLRLANNLSRLCHYIVDKVVHGLFPQGGNMVFAFLLHFLERMEDGDNTQASSPASARLRSDILQQMYRALNRIIIHLLGVPYGRTREDFLSVIQSIVFHQRVVFSPHNQDSEFIHCLCYVLYKFLLDDNRRLREGSMNVWKLLLLTRHELLAEILVYRAPKGQESIDLLTNGFDQLLHKDLNQFSFWVGDTVQAIHTVLEERLSKVWLAFREGESRAKLEHLKRIKSRRSSRLQKQEKRKRAAMLQAGKVSHWRTNNTNLIHEKAAERFRKLRQEEVDKRLYASELWRRMRQSFTSERAIWGPAKASPLDKFKLDSTEGPFRMRKKLQRNQHFYEHYPYNAAQEHLPSSSKDKLPTSFDSKLYYELYGSSNTSNANSLTFSTPQGAQRRRDSVLTLMPLDTPSSSTPRSAELLMLVEDNSPSPPTTPRSSAHFETDLTPRTPYYASFTGLALDASTNANSIAPSPASSLPSSSSSSPTSTSIASHPSGLAMLEESPQLLGRDGGDDEDSLTPRTLSENTTTTTTTTTDDTHSVSSEEGDAVGMGVAGVAADDDGGEDEEIADALETEDDAGELLEGDDDGGEDDEGDKIHRLLEPHDHIEHIYNCSRVEGMDKREGLFLICTDNIYIIDDYQRSSSGEIVEVEREQPDSTWSVPSLSTTGTGLPVSNATTPTATSNSNHRCRKWAKDYIRDAFKRRYLLQPVAIEIFSNDGRNYLVVFDASERDEVYQNLAASISSSGTTTADISGAQSSVDGSDAASSKLDVRMRLTFWRTEDSLLSNTTQRWLQGQISNFQYLVYLNTLAGRSYNDLTQYPVFPWVLADYESETLDLNDATVYRDLSKPMGALTPARAAEFAQRYEIWEPAENGHVPKFHYGTHYSSAGVVLYYLIRLEPFTQHFLKLQGGRFDVADRLFYSINETWQSAAGFSSNLADVKELIPEFYYLPEMLQNANRFDFGTKQTGERIDNVVLPPWAKGDPYEFVRVMRQALESEHVSEHLHEWIDLVFGFRQQGRDAEEALNVFYYLTYEGAINIAEITDPVERTATIAQINNFGQTPKQLFTRPHPQRQSCSALPRMAIIHTLLSPHLEKTTIVERGEPTGSIRVLGERLLMTGINKAMVMSRNSTPRIMQWGFLDDSIRLRQGENERVLAVLESPHIGPVSCVCITDDGYLMCSGGTNEMLSPDATDQRNVKCVSHTRSHSLRHSHSQPHVGEDSVIAVHRIHPDNHKGQVFELLGKLTAHVLPVTAVAVSRAFSVIVTGSEDRTCIVRSVTDT